MMRCFWFGAVLAVCLLGGTAADAQVARTFVSGTGTDTGACSPSAPCRSFQYAIGQTSTGGEIIVLSSAGYGQINITKSISISNPTGLEAGISAPSGGTAVAINTTGSVAIRGLTLEGGTGGAVGISSGGGGTLEIMGCVIRNFSQAGISLNAAAPTYFLIDKTALQGNLVGVLLQNGPIGTISNSTIFGSQTSTSSAGVSMTGGSYPDNNVNFIRDTIVNNYNGINNSSEEANISQSSLANNNTDVMNTSILFIGSSSAQAGITNQGGSVYTYGNNNISGTIQGSVTTIPQR